MIKTSGRFTMPSKPTSGAPTPKILSAEDIARLSSLDIKIPITELAKHTTEPYASMIVARHEALEKGLSQSQWEAIRDAMSSKEAKTLGADWGVDSRTIASLYEKSHPALPRDITLPLSDAERQKLATLREQAKCPADEQRYEPRIYKAGLKDGGYVLVEDVNEKKAQQRAEQAGYKVAWVKWSPKYEKPTPKAKVEGTTKVKDGKTGDTLEFPKSGWEAWPDKYKTIVKRDGYDAAMREFKFDYYQLGDGQWLLKSDFYALPTRYADIAATKGIAAMQQAFEADHVKLGDGQWLPRADWNILAANDVKAGTNFAYIGKTKGYTAMVAAIDKANEPYEEFQQKIKAGDIIPVPGDQYITKQEFDKLPSGSQQILREQGFEALAKATTITYKKLTTPVGVSKERLAAWKAMPDTISQAEMNKLSFLEKGYYRLSEESYGRAGLVALSSFMPPAKVALPEYTKADITAFDWGIAAAQAPLIVLGFAPTAITSSVAGRALTVTGASALSGIIGYGTAKNWDSLTPGQRVMGVSMAALCAVPLITTIARNVKISGTPIPTTEGNAVAWKGLSVAGHPIIGRSGGKWVLGTRSITLPEARMILNGYKPEMMLETKVFVNRTALTKAGFSPAQIDYLTKTLKTRNLFAGKSSPWLDKNVLIEPTQRLNANEINTIMQRLARLDKAKAGALKDAHLLYGSPTMKAQLAPKLRGWRPIHDWDISLNMNQAQTEAFTRALLKDLQAKGGGTYRINPQKPTIIEKKINGTFKGNHIADIHSQQEVSTSAIDLPASKLDATGTYSYGRMVSEPAITVKYPGVGELRIMRLSESGVRKADTILRVRQTGEGTAFRPPERGIAQPGVPKDAADFYVTLRTFQGEQIAEEWLKAWAKAMGYTDDWLTTVMKKTRVGTKPPTVNWNEWVTTTLKNEMISVSSQTPSSIIGYDFRPAASPRVSVGASPSIVIHVPSSLGASVSASLERQISKPIYPYQLSKSPQMQAAISAGLSALISKAPSKAIPSPKISPGVARSIAASASPKPSPSPAVSKVPSPSAKPSASPIPSMVPSGKPSPSARPSKVPSPILSPKPSPIPSPTPTPSPKPSPYPYPYPKPGPKPKPLPRVSMPKPSKKVRRESPALVTWKQGLYYVSIYPPFRTKDGKPDVAYSRHRPLGALIAKGRHAPRKTLKGIGEVPPVIELPMGVVTARVKHGRQLVFSRRRVNGSKKRMSHY